MNNKIGKVFNGKISGVTNFGLFVTLDEIASDGLVPIRTLPNDFYKFDEKRMLLKGSRNKKDWSASSTLEIPNVSLLRKGFWRSKMMNCWMRSASKLK